VDCIKLSDFGLSETLDDDAELVGIAGSKSYMAPEVINQTGHGKPVDIYALGVILHILLCGYPPFEPEKASSKLEFPDSEWSGISPEVKDLIQNMLLTDPDQRWPATKILEHSWFEAVKNLPELNNPLKFSRKNLGTWKDHGNNFQNGKTNMEKVISDIQMELQEQQKKMTALLQQVSLLRKKYSNHLQALKLDHTKM